MDLPAWHEPGDPAARAAAVSDEFVRRHGRPPDVVAVAPGRVNLIGEHTDHNGGRCLPLALPHATYAAAAVRTDGLLGVASTAPVEPWRGRRDRLGPGAATGWAAYPAGVLWALAADGVAIPGLDLLVDSSVPTGAGLSSSAALTCAVGVAACALAGVPLTEAGRDRILRAGVRAENDAVGVPTGGLDQTVALHATGGHALLLDFADGSRDPVPLAGLAGSTLLVVDTGVRHRLAEGGYAARVAECAAAAAALGVRDLSSARTADVSRLDDPVLRRRARHVVTENRRVVDVVDALRHVDPATVGRALSASHASLRDDFEVSCTELDAVVTAAASAGALGARMTGGGFGGSALVLVRTQGVAEVVEAVGTALAAQDAGPPSYLLAGDGGPGARVLLPG